MCVDIGSTHTGYAFSSRAEYEAQMLNVHTNEEWMSGHANLHTFKVKCGVNDDIDDDDDDDVLLIVIVIMIVILVLVVVVTMMVTVIMMVKMMLVLVVVMTTTMTMMMSFLLGRYVLVLTLLHVNCFNYTLSVQTSLTFLFVLQ